MTAAGDAAAGYRRVGSLFIECGEREWLDPLALLGGRLALGPQPVLRAWAPPAHAPHHIDPLQAWLLASLPAHALAPLPHSPLADAAAVQQAADQLIERGLILRTPREHSRTAFADWWAPAALYHFSSRWQQVLARDEVPVDADSAARAFADSQQQFAAQADARGAPPSHAVRWGDEGTSIALPASGEDDLDRLLRTRETHRLFDTTRPLPLALAAQLLRRGFGVYGEAPLGGGLVALRKGAPSGGGMHPSEACVLAIDVDGLRPGWYHYRGDQHRLAPIRLLDAGEARERVVQYTAGQRYFASAPLCIALVLRYPRHHWKYPQHAKALRVMLLEAGHLGQSVYLAATAAGLGAFFTAAINETELDADLGLDGVEAGSIALLGAGWPAADGAALRLSHYQQAPAGG